MRLFEASSRNVEVNGETVYAIIDGMGVFKSRAIAILAENGIIDPKSGSWHKQQDWLNAFKEIAENVGSNALKLIGQKIPENAKFPPNITDIHQALTAIDKAYHMNHRRGYIGHYTYNKRSDCSGKMVCTTPYPDEFDRGIIISVGQTYKPKNAKNLNVEIDKSAPIRTKGGESTTYIIKW